MFTFDNTHIFTGYLKQMLATIPIPSCKVYTKEFAKYYKKHGVEDPRVVESINAISADRPALQVNYIKDGSIYYYGIDTTDVNKLSEAVPHWKRASKEGFDPRRNILGITKTLHSPTSIYDTKTHEYLGEYLRFLRDYYDINLMSLYNCFSNAVCNNIFLTTLELYDTTTTDQPRINFNSRDQQYRIYALPVKLFQDYTVAIDCAHGIELFCGFYKTKLDITSDRGKDLIRRTYTKIPKTVFSQPFLYTKLNVKNWSRQDEFRKLTLPGEPMQLTCTNIVSRFDVISKEQDLKLFIKVPTTCQSSIVILEGDFRHYNDFKYAPVPVDSTDLSTSTYRWAYSYNRLVSNFCKTASEQSTDPEYFKPISKLQLLAFNTGASYPFADRLVEYLVGSAITPIDEITDNIHRTQKVMEQNGYFFKIKGVWEDRMQKLLYDYMMNSGPIVLDGTKLTDKRQGRHTQLGYTSKSTIYDILGYADRDVEKSYASWKKQENKAVIADSLQDVDIYNGLYDIK